jgi:hypothetical protein
VRFLDENFPWKNFTAFREFLDEGSAYQFRPVEMYTKVRETREALRMIAAHRKEKSLFDLNFYFPWHEVGSWGLDRIRLCENCGAVFFATRNNKLTHSGSCATARRVREWRKHQDQYEQARKRKPTVEVKRDSRGGKNVTRKAR